MPTLGSSRRESSTSALSTEIYSSIVRALKRWRKTATRYGVIFRKLLDRESISIPWRDLLCKSCAAWKLVERFAADGFVGGFSGEQFATAEAVQLRDRFAGRR